MAELAAKSNQEAVDVINKRVSESLDEMRDVFPGKPSGSLKKALDECDGDVQQAIVLLQSRGFTD